MGEAPEGRRLTAVEDPGFSASLPFGRFGSDELLRCYATGVFPMGEGRDDPRVFLVEPDQRGVIPLDGFHIPARLRRTVRSEPFEIRRGERIAQLVVVPVVQMELEVVESFTATDRGELGFGSTGKK